MLTKYIGDQEKTIPVDLQLKCDHPDCISRNKTFKNKRALAAHKYGIHTKVQKERIQQQMAETDTTKNMEKDVVPNITPEAKTVNVVSQTVDLTDLTKKIDTLTSMIPPNLCEEFPKLCGLNTRIDAIEQNINAVQKKIPKRIDVKIPALDDLDKTATKEELAALKEELTTIQTGISDKAATLQEGLFTRLDSLVAKMNTPESKKLQDPSGPKESEKKGIEEETTVSTATVHTTTPVPEAEEEPVHKHPEDFFDCPECSAKLLTALTKKITTDGESKEIRDFLNFIKQTVAQEGNHVAKDVDKGRNDEAGHNPTSTPGNAGGKTENRSEKVSGEDSKRRDDGGNDRTNTKSTSEQGGPNAGTAREELRPEPTVDSEECRGGFCLLKKRKGKK